MVAALNAELGGALEVGDLAAARVAYEALGKLLGTGGDTGTQPVVDLASERKRRGGDS